MKVLKKNNGFTLVELIVVIAIVGILAAVLIPSLSGYVSKAKDSAALQEAETIKTAYLTWQIEKENDIPYEGDFDVYLKENNLLGNDQTISKIKKEDPPGGFYDFTYGFIFTASNDRIVKGLWSEANQKLTLEIVKGDA